MRKELATLEDVIFRESLRNNWSFDRIINTNFRMFNGTEERKRFVSKLNNRIFFM